MTTPETAAQWKMEVLLVEDNPADVRLLREALREVPYKVNLNLAGDGMEALSFLRRVKPYENVPRPSLVLLDLNMPVKNGREVLREIKTDPDLRSIPVVVLTTSEAPGDIDYCYGAYANAYVVKPRDLESFMAAVRGIWEFWFGVARIPARP